MSASRIERGDIFYVHKNAPTYGSEQMAGRPAIIVSNDKNNQNSETVEVVYLTTQPKTPLPTHVTIRSTSRVSTALCEQITTVSIERLGDYVGQVSASEMTNLEIAMLASLDLICGGGGKRTSRRSSRRGRQGSRERSAGSGRSRAGWRDYKCRRHHRRERYLQTLVRRTPGQAD